MYSSHCEYFLQIAARKKILEKIFTPHINHKVIASIRKEEWRENIS